MEGYEKVIEVEDIIADIVDTKMEEMFEQLECELGEKEILAQSNKELLPNADYLELRSLAISLVLEKLSKWMI